MTTSRIYLFIYISFEQKVNTTLIFQNKYMIQGLSSPSSRYIHKILKHKLFKTFFHIIIKLFLLSPQVGFHFCKKSAIELVFQ